MIVSFKSEETKLIFEGFRSRHYPNDIQSVASRKLAMLDAASSINDLRVPPKNRLEKLKGDDQWRICFIWTDEGNASQVEIVDYH